MSRQIKWLLVVVGFLLVTLLVTLIYFSGRKALNSFFYPAAPSMPPIVQTSTSELLQQLEKELRTKFPAIGGALQPGLSDTEISALETKAGFKLNDDLRAFYRWHNGLPTNSPMTLITGHYFFPLQRVVLEYNLMKDTSGQTAAQSAAVNVLLDHRKHWISILPDSAGDGFFYDPQRKDAEGAFFYSLAEDSTYFYFPSFRNFLAATIDGIKTDAYFLEEDGKNMNENYEQLEVIWKKYGASPMPE